MREIKLANNAADKFYASMYGMEPMAQQSVAAKRMYTRHAQEGLSELQHQIRVVAWWDKRCGDWGLPPFALMAIPNGGGRAAIDAANLKRSGVRRGAEDLFLAAPRNGYHGLFLEMKMKGGSISDEQHAMAEYHFAQKYQSHVAWDNEQAIDLIRDYLAPQI